MAEAKATHIAVVGFGPRGLGALEALAAEARTGAGRLRVDVFDPFHAPGAGPNFDPDESRVCLLNIPMRDIDIRPPAFSRCGGFADWLTDTPDEDAFPSRADLGRYLEARYADLRRHAGLDLTHHASAVDALSGGADAWFLHAGGTSHGPYAEVLLTLGQPEVAPDDQLAEWQEHAARSDGLLRQAYPAARLQAEAAGWTGQTIAVRGLALSAFDVLRVLTLGQGGRFENGRYVASGAEPALIAPFSLDGHPPYPKPETAARDARFTPTPEETARFADAMAEAAVAGPDAARRLIDAALVPVAQRILDALGAPGGTDAAATWLDREWDDPGAQETGTAEQVLQDGIAMAEGSRPPSTGYVIGQVWRKWQNEIRRGYNPARTPPETAEALVGFDDGLKRYSYGPPVTSSRELSALVSAGLVTLDVSADPEIALADTGWTLTGDGGSITAGVMIDGVLPSPDLSAMRDSLIRGLLDDGRLRAIAEGLAADISADGQLVGQEGQVVPGLSFLGRLALGSVIAADSLHDCFGQASVRWARAVNGRSTRQRT